MVWILFGEEASMPKRGRDKRIENCGNFRNAHGTPKGARVDKSLLLKNCVLVSEL